MKTSEFARISGLNPQSIRGRFQKTGSYYGIVPLKLPNGRLEWPKDSQKRRFNARHNGSVILPSDKYNLYRLFNLIPEECKADVDRWIESRELPMYHRGRQIFSRIQGESLHDSVSEANVIEMCNAATDIILRDLLAIMKKRGRPIPDAIKPKIVYD